MATGDENCPRPNSNSGRLRVRTIKSFGPQSSKPMELSDVFSSWHKHAATLLLVRLAVGGSFRGNSPRNSVSCIIADKRSLVSLNHEASQAPSRL